MKYTAAMMMTTATAMVQVMGQRLPDGGRGGYKKEAPRATHGGLSLSPNYTPRSPRPLPQNAGMSYDGAVGFGHIFVKAEPADVAALLGRHLGDQGFAPVVMTPDQHPTKMKQMHENQMRLYWISPRLAGWTGIFEFRYYNNED